jgi:alpha-tubulin suppressor-like RCC1 family protein
MLGSHDWRGVLGEGWVRWNVVALLAMVFCVAGLAVCYAMLETRLQVEGEVTVNDSELVRVGDVQPSVKAPQCGVATSPASWDVNRFRVYGELPALNCTLAFDVLVKNDSDVDMSIKQIVQDTFNNATNMMYELSIVPGAVVRAHDELTVVVEFRYAPGLGALPTATSFWGEFHLVFEGLAPPIIAVSDSYRDYAMYTQQTLDVDAKVSALDDVDGDITASLTKTCRLDSAAVPCPASFTGAQYGQYAITYSVTNSRGVPAVPVTINVLVWSVIKIDSGMYHTLAMTSDGKVYTWGYDNYGQQGDGVQADAFMNTPHRVTLNLVNKKVVDIAAGDYTSHVVTADGEVYSWGSNDTGQIGNGTTAVLVPTPTRANLPAGVRAAQISSEDDSVMVVDDAGKVWAWGSGDGGLLGQMNANGTAYTVSNQHSPVAVKDKTGAQMSGVREVSVGWVHSMAITTDGRLLVWGRNSQSQLGKGDSVDGNGFLADFYTGLTGVKQISVGYATSRAVLDNGELYTWGYNVFGEGCVGNTYEIHAPKLVTDNVAVVNGHYWTTLYVKRDGTMYGCGNGAYGKLGTGNITTRTSPYRSVKFDTHPVLMPAAGYDTSFILTTDGGVYGIGYGGYGVLGSGNNNSSLSPYNATIWAFNPPVEKW